MAKYPSRPKQIALDAAEILRKQHHPLVGSYTQTCADVEGGRCYCIEGAIKQAGGWYDLTVRVSPASEQAIYHVIVTFAAVNGRSPVLFNDRNLKARKTTQSHVKALLKTAEAL